MNEVFRLATMIGSSSLEDSYCEDSHSSFREELELEVFAGFDASLTTTVSVLALPLASIVKITSVRDLGTRDSGIAVRLLGRCRLIGEDCPRERSRS